MVFVDAGPFVALYGKQDQYHRDAVRLWRQLKGLLVTTNHVVDEVTTAIGSGAGYEHAADRVEEIYKSSRFDVITSTRSDELDALAWMRKYADQEVGFTDCVSFAIMRRTGLRAAFTFDRHFRDAGFQVIGLR